MDPFIEKFIPNLSRRSSFAGTGFEKLAQTEKEESDLDGFFRSEKVYIVFTNAGKPVYSS